MVNVRRIKNVNRNKVVITYTALVICLCTKQFTCENNQANQNLVKSIEEEEQSLKLAQEQPWYKVFATSFS